MEITPQIYLGEDQDSHDLTTLKTNNVGCVMNCTKSCVEFHDELPKDIERVRIPVHDNDRKYDIVLFNMLPFAVLKIDDTIRAGRSVLCHCLSGRQRSPTVIAAYLMLKHSMSVNDAISFIQSKKPIVFTPKINFVLALEWWNHTLRNDQKHLESILDVLKLRNH